jgi:hypothetical protein
MGVRRKNGDKHKNQKFKIKALRELFKAQFIPLDFIVGLEEKEMR